MTKPEIQPVFYREAEVLALIGCSKATLARWRQAGRFPQPVELGPNSLAWRREDVEAWIASRQTVEPDSADARRRQQQGREAAEARFAKRNQAVRIEASHPGSAA